MRFVGRLKNPCMAGFQSTWIGKLAAFSFLFFLIKGMLWLGLFALVFFKLP